MTSLRALARAAPAHAPPQAASAPMVRGVPDGADVVLPSGVRIRCTSIAGLRVSYAELVQAIRGVQLLPLAHQRLVAQSGTVIELVPLAGLETSQHGKAMLGATSIDQQGVGGSWRPTLIRVAVRSPESRPGTREAIGEIVQHEVGHVISVLAGQDRGEDAAERYASAY